MIAQVKVIATMSKERHMQRRKEREEWFKIYPDLIIGIHGIAYYSTIISICMWVFMCVLCGCVGVLYTGMCV